MKKLLSFLILSVFTTMAFAQVRISQVYGGGGNAATSPYTRDFIEIFNAGSSTVAIGGWSVQYASSAGTSWQVTAIPAGTMLQAGQYFLIAEAAGTTTTTALPTPDVTGSINMSGTAGKALLANVNTAAPAATTPTSGIVVDWVAFGSGSTPSEGGSPGGTPTPAPSNTTSVFRASNGCVDTDNNANDFAAATPVARNTASALNPCSGGPVASLVIASNITGLSTVSGTASTPPATFTVSGTNLTGFPGNLTVTATANIEVASASGGPYTNSLSVAYTSATLTAVTLYARIKSTAPLGTLSGETITVSGGSAPTSPSITVSGNVVSAEPLTQATNVSISNITNTTFDIDWTNGDGSSRIVVIRATSTTPVAPLDGSVYSASTSPSANITGTGNFVLFSGSGTGPVTFTGLTPGTSYTVQAYEYNGGSGTSNYNTNTAAGNPATATTTGVSPLLQQINFTGISVPLYMAPNTGRLPVMFYATVSNLLPSTAYRYFVLGSAGTDIGGSTTAGIPIMIDYNNGNNIYYESSASIASATPGQYGTFTTNASGSFSGSFGFTASSNARFSAGSTVFPAISLGVDNGTSTVVTNRYQLNQSITVLGYGTTLTTGTYIRGTSSATPKNLVALYKSPDGSSLLAGRPLYVTLAEDASVTGGGGWANANFVTGYNTANGTWNALIPNNNPAGVELIQQIDLANGSVVGCSSDDDGTWLPGNVVTSNPSGGTTPVLLTSAEAPLTGAACFSILAVNLNNFTAVKKGNVAKLNWSTAQEVNSSSFDVLRSTDGVNWKTVATVAAAGNSNTARNYEAYDNAPVPGRNLYRLRSVDADGSSKLSDIRTLIFSEKFEITVSPNPVKDVININISKKGNNPVQIALINNTGAVVGKYITNSTSYSINAAGLNKGLYILKIISEDITTTEKIIIQ